MKIVINDCYGGFSLSHNAVLRYGDLTGYCPKSLDRSDPTLVQVVEEMGDDANGRFASLKIVEIPDDIKWQIEEYDGIEWVAEQHRVWS